MSILSILSVLFLNVFSFGSEVVPAGAIRGSCTMMANSQFTIQNNLRLDSNGSQLPQMPSTFGGAKAPVEFCPHYGQHTDVRCSSGWKPVMTGIVQMDCRTSNAASLCHLYYISYGCAKL